MRGQPKAGLRIAKWDRALNWKFRGICSRANHFLGLTDLGQKGRREKNKKMPHLIRDTFFKSMQCRLLFALAYTVSKSNLRCVGSCTEEVWAATEFPFLNWGIRKISGNVHCTVQWCELVPSTTPSLRQSTSVEALARLPRQTSSVRGLPVRVATSAAPSPSPRTLSLWPH